MQERLSNRVTVHRNYECDGCKATPIIGIRFHCVICEDFDLCEECKFREEHPHDMERIEMCGRGKQMKGVASMLVQPICGKIPLRPPPNITQSIDLGKVHRSAIR
jgi:hypothetical protein